MTKLAIFLNLCLAKQNDTRSLRADWIGFRYKARVEGEVSRKTRVLCEVYADNTLTALGDSILVRVDIGHLAKKAHTETV